MGLSVALRRVMGPSSCWHFGLWPAAFSLFGSARDELFWLVVPVNRNPGGRNLGQHSLWGGGGLAVAFSWLHNVCRWGKAGSFLFDQNISEICLRGRPCILLTSSVVGIRDSVGLWVQGSGEEAGWHQPSTLLLRGGAEGQLSSRVWCRGSVDHTGCRCTKKVPGSTGVFGPPLFYNFFSTAFVINVYFIYTIL